MLTTRHQVFDIDALWDLIFAYAANTSWFYTLLRYVPPLAEQVPDLAPYVAYRKEQDKKEWEEQFLRLEDARKKLADSEEQSRQDLAAAQQKIEDNFKEMIKRLEAKKIEELEQLEPGFLENEKQKNEAIINAVAEAEQALVGERSISFYNDLLGMMDQFIELESKEELSLGPWWKRIKIRTGDRLRHAMNGADQGGEVGVTLGLALAAFFVFTTPLPLLPTSPLSLLFLCQAVAILLCATVLVALIGAALFAFFEIGRPEKSKAQDMLSTFSPALVDQFEKIKSWQAILLNDNDEQSLSTINATTHTLNQVTSEVKNRHRFFTTLIQSKAAEEEKKLEVKDVNEVKKINIQPPPDNSLSLG